MSEIKGVFDIVKNIQSSHELLSEEEVREFSNPYILNRALSFNTDTIFFADEASTFTSVDPWAQYLFYFYSIDKKKYRPGRWEKKEVSPDSLSMIQEAFDVSESKALEYLEILSDEQVDIIIEFMNKGGLIGRKPRKSK